MINDMHTAENTKVVCMYVYILNNTAAFLTILNYKVVTAPALKWLSKQKAVLETS